MSFSPDGTRLAAASRDGAIRLWDASTGEELRTLKGYADGHTGFDASQTISFASTGGEEVMIAGGGVSVSFSPDGTRVASGGWDNTLSLWETSKGEELRVLNGHTGTLFDVSFGSNGKRLYSQSSAQRLVWSAGTGQIIPEAEWKPQPENHSNERWLAIPSGRSILLVDTTFKNRVREKAYRAFKAKPKPWWHEERSATAEATGKWFAAALHAGQLLKLEPTSRVAFDRLSTSWDKLGSKQKALLPQLVSDSKAIRKPPIPSLTAYQARSVNNRLWQRVVSGEVSPNQYELEWMQAVVRDFPRGHYFNTLGASQYRTGSFRSAIKACQESVEFTPRQFDSPHATAYAFLAMSHFRLGNKEKAEEFRNKLIEAMELDIFKDDKECLGLVKEVNELFDAGSKPPSDKEDNK